MTAACCFPRCLTLIVLLLTSMITAGELYLEQPPRPPRVYAAAPSGVDVTVVRAVQISRSTGTRTPTHEPHFSLHRSNKTDHRYFHIDERHGNITTARYIEVPTSHQYQLMVMVLVSGRAIYKELEVTVTQYNKHAPVLDLEHYSAEVVGSAGVGTPILTVTATDQDPEKYNSEVLYFLANHSTPFHLNPFFDPLNESPLRIDTASGTVRVSRDLRQSTSPLQLLVGAVDGGSPQRYTLANLTVYIREMPAPRSVLVTNTSDTSFTVCWVPPAFGHPEGYILSYIPVGHRSNLRDSFLNVTTEQLHKKLSTWSGSEEVATRGDGVISVYRYCALVGGLTHRTQYLVGVRAWAGQEISMASASVKAATMTDYCVEGVCRIGNCSLQRDPPGYSCQCPSSHYGNKCERLNPCLPENPCKHLGKCLNKTDDSYTCECLHGFYGPNCTLLDPCLAVSDNPCINGGVCVRRSKLPQNSTGEKSEQYECVCREGYYGMRCEHQNPCLPNPCEHGSRCNNLFNGSFSCACSPGFTGTRCQEEVNECEPNPCVGGVCTDLLNDYDCHCPKGWGGKNCDEDLDECASSPCFNGATCIDLQASYVCDCAHGYSGLKCNIPESCPAQTTQLNTGEFHWPATHHGEWVTIDCPFGARTPSTEERSTDMAAASLNTLVPSSHHELDYLGFEEAALATENPRPSSLTTMFAKKDGDNFQLSRSSRDVHFPSDSRRYTRDSFQQRRHRIISSMRGISPRKSEKRHHNQRQHRQGGQSRHRTEKYNLRQEGHVEYQRRENHHHSRNQGNLTDKMKESDGKRHMNAKHEQPGELQIRMGPRTDPFTDTRSKVKDTDRQNTNPSIKDMPQVHPRLIKRKDHHASHAIDNTSNHGHQEREANISDNLTITGDTTGTTDLDLTHLRNQEEKQRDGNRDHANEPMKNEFISQHEHFVNLGMSPATEFHHKNIKERTGRHNRHDPNLHNSKAIRTCTLLPNGTVVWREPDASMCREEAMQGAEKAAEEVVFLTKSPSSVDSSLFTHAADQLAKLVEHAIKDRRVAISMVKALSNMMEVNDSVVAVVDKESNVTKQILNTIKSFTRNVALEVGETVTLQSPHLVMEARLLDSSVNNDITFQPRALSGNLGSSHTQHTRKSTQMQPSILLPSEVLKVAGKRNVRLEFVSFGNDKFFRSNQQSGLPVIRAEISNTEVHNLSHAVTYEIPVGLSDGSGAALKPVCVFWDEEVHNWSTEGLRMVQVNEKNVCQASHLTAFSILLDPVPAAIDSHDEALSIITYIGLVLSTTALMATVATYALFRTLNRDRSGKIVMNLSLVLLLLNVVFIIDVHLKPPSVECTVLAALLHYLVVAAFSWMLVEAANMYQLLITVFASAETHFMAKRVIAAWGVPAILVVIALCVDKGVYADPDHGYCVISPLANPALYYSTYLGPICLVLLVNCIVFVMVTRVLCQRRPRSSKPKTPSSSPHMQMPITLAQVRGAVTVVALLGITWVAGALSFGGARLILQYVFCITTPLQGLVIFVVRVAQHSEARTAWITLFTTGTLRRRPPTTHTHSTHSSGHTNSTLSTLNTPRNNTSSTRTTSTRISLKTPAKATHSSQKKSSEKSWAIRNGSICKYSSKNKSKDEMASNMGTVFARLVKRLSTSGQENEKNRPAAKNTEKTNLDLASVPIPDLDPSIALNQDHLYFCEVIPETAARFSQRNKMSHRPQSLVLLRTESNGGAMTTNSSTLSQSCINTQYPLLSSNLFPQELVEAGIPSSLAPRRSLGSILITGGKEGDDTSWHFVRPPPDGHSNPVSEGESVFIDTDILPGAEKRQHEKPPFQKRKSSETRNNNGCVVLAGQMVATKNSAVSEVDRKLSAPNLLRANSESQMNSSLVSVADLRRSASVYTLGEWEDPRSSLS